MGGLGHSPSDRFLAAKEALQIHQHTVLWYAAEVDVCV